MPELIPFPVDRTDVTPYFEALDAALDGSGPALAPFAAGTEAPDVPRHPDDAPESLALVVSTSGSTGAPKRAMLTREALIASARATNDRIGGAGTWLLPLPPEHIAGTQVLVRSLVAGTTPIVMDSWSVEMFAKATALVARNAPPNSPIHTSLVPTQLRDVLADEVTVSAARRYRSILVGGAATPPELRTAALDAGLAVRMTYGSSETAGGCVYDGIPLEGTAVGFIDSPDSTSGRITLSGPTIAAGYLGDAARTAEHFAPASDADARHTDARTSACRRFVTDDLGRLEDALLRVEGRIDDVITSGGYKISPSVVETVVRSHPAVQDAVCLGLPDARLGQSVSIAVTLTEPSLQPEALDTELLDVCRRALPPYAVPRRIATFDRLPARGIGKPDRTAIATHENWRNLRSAT